jgi:hypothetical protein
MSDSNSNLFLEAGRQKLRFTLKPGTTQRAQTTAGVCSTEDLWDLSLDQLDGIAICLAQEIKETPAVSYVNPEATATKASTKLQLAFDVVIAVIKYQTEVRDRKRLAAAASASSQENQELIRAALAEAKIKELSTLSIAELEAKLSAKQS